MIHPNFQKYLENLIEKDGWDDDLYLVLYEALEESIEIDAEPPTVEEFSVCYKQVAEKFTELNIPITEKGLLQTINGWMFVLLRKHPKLIVGYGRILGLTPEEWRKAIEEIRDDMTCHEYYLGDEAVANIDVVEKGVGF